MRFNTLLIIFLSFSLNALSQEVLTGLHENPMVRAKFLELQHSRNLSGLRDTVPINLPFFDDFSGNNVFPDTSRWIDRYGFENTDIPVFPVNIGAMTLDALNDSGMLYPNAVPGPVGTIADHLTSRYIRLDSVFSPVARALSPADSVYLSFYYQPQGRALAPQPADSLILEFLAIPAHDSILPDTVIKVPDTWRQVWYANGSSLNTFYLQHNQWFVQEMIPITDPSLFTDKFRFRFLNYVSLASSVDPSWQSNCDQWNIDNVYLNINRSAADTVYPELRFIYRPQSLLTKYESMPYPQYCDNPTGEMRDSLDVFINNRDIKPYMSSYDYYVTDPAGSFSKSYDGGNYNIQPYTVTPWVTYQKFAHPEVDFFMPISQADSAVYRVKHIVRENTPGSAVGDTMEYLQRFYNYFAYDDGTPEASYGLTPSGSKLAYRFKLNKSPDTLRAINWFFTRTFSNASQQFFYLCVWNDNAGKPGDTIFSDYILPKYTDTLNKFVTYHLNPPLRITGTFYVGWIQTTDDNLSVGFDRYNNSQKEIFYNVAGEWNNSSYTGSLMIRPVVGKPIPLGTGDLTRREFDFTVYPNPSDQGELHMVLPGSHTLNTSGMQIRITNLLGRTVYSARYNTDLDVSRLPKGLYFLSLLDQNGHSLSTKKIILSR